LIFYILDLKMRLPDGYCGWELMGVAFLFAHCYNLRLLKFITKIVQPMKSEKPENADRLKSIFSITILIILALAVGFLSVNFISALYAKFA